MTKCLSAALVGVLMHGLSAADVVFPAVEWATSPSEAQGIDAATIDAAMARVAEVCGKDGNGETMLIRNGYVLWQGDRIDNRHVVWSCTKSFMSTCFGLLWDDGKCSPATKVADIIPELAEYYPEVTIEHLATFTSGYGDGSDDPTQAPPPMYAPGAAFHYSHQSNVLAAVLTRIAGESLNDLFQRRIGSIIGLTEADFHWGAQDIPGSIAVNGGAGSPNSAVQISARGMARFGWLYAQRGVWNGEQLISTRYIDYATVPRLNPPPPPHDLKAWYVDLPGRYGLNWWVNGVDSKGQRLWPSLPVSTFAAQGNKNNLCVIVPEWNLVLVRLGQDAIIDISLFDPCFAQIGEALRASGNLPVPAPTPMESQP